MKSAIFLTWFFTIVFFSHGVNTQGASATPAAKHVEQAVAAVVTPPANRLQPVELVEEASAETLPADYIATTVEPGAGDTPRYNPLAQHAQRYGADAESYYQDKQDQLLQALMK